jgi:hypothetical protein
MKTIPGIGSLLLAMGSLLFACNTVEQSGPEVRNDIDITLSILYCTAAEFDQKLVCIDGPNNDRCPNCQAIGNRPPTPNPNKPNARRGNLLLKYVIENNSFNLYGWSYDLNRNSSKDFDDNPNIKLTIGTPVPNVKAVNGTQLGDLIWGYNTMAKIHCDNTPPNRKNYILLVPSNFTAADGSIQVKWSVFKTNDDPANSIFSFNVNDKQRFEEILNGAPNPIPPKSFNTEWGDN